MPGISCNDRVWLVFQIPDSRFEIRDSRFDVHRHPKQRWYGDGGGRGTVPRIVGGDAETVRKREADSRRGGGGGLLFMRTTDSKPTSCNIG